ncbi:aluminum-activated malate transporter 12-like [Trifolium pratense]|uniref:aluminum-activated malate transporter 12-like n=1 Tax=Trifolium pratense TaxID=57577 RepID=UPI001E692E51|nr:aluminum-activated malate transporter 12-like [Trifolium pratense]
MATICRSWNCSLTIQTPETIRVKFKDPCIRLAAEVSKVLIELANSIKNRRHCSPEILSDYLHEALEELDAAIKYHLRLFLGSNEIQANKPAPAIAATTQAGTIRQKVLERSQTSKMAINSLHFSEALPFALKK